MAQTELAGLLPPSLREKARFMNLKPTIVWGLQMLKLLARGRSGETVAGVRPERLEEKLGWLVEFEPALCEWREWLQLIDTTLGVLRTQGHSLGTPALLDRNIAQPLRYDSSDKLWRALREFVASISGGLHVFERFPGSSEVLESIFGKFKRLERQQSRSGFTSLVLSLGVLVGKMPGACCQTINAALERTGVKNVVLSRVTQMFGMSVGSQRRLVTEAAK